MLTNDKSKETAEDEAQPEWSDEQKDKGERK